MTPRTPLETAIDLLNRGLWPIPITAPDTPGLVSPGKQPIGAAWGETRHTPESLEAVYAANPGAGVGLKLGPEGFVVDIDIDDPELAAPVLKRIFGEALPATLGWSSARGGHLLFAWDPSLEKYGKAIVKNHPEYPGLEIRLGWSAEGRQYQSVVPPSIGTDGKPREWNTNPKILPLPESFFEDLDRHLLAKPEEPRRKLVVQRGEEWTPERRAVAYLARCEPAISGQHGHDKAFKAACKVGPGFDLDPATALRLLLEQFNPRCEPPWSERELAHKVEEAYKVESRRGWLLEDDRKQNAVTVTEDGVGEADDDPHRLARIYLAQNSTPDGEPTLRYWLEEWHRWDGTHYQIVPDTEVRAEINGCIKAEFDRIARESKKVAIKVTTGVTSNTMAAVQNLCLLQSRKCPSQPAWLGYEDEDLPDPKEILPARNGLIHLPALIEGREAILAPTPLYFSPNTLGYDFVQGAKPPTEWLNFLGSLWGDDHESIESLQEWFGYLLTADTSQQKILMIVGPKRSGKGTIARILAAVVGRQNVSSPTLSGLATNFGLAPLIGKTVAIFADARLSGRVDSQVIVERLLSISGEDSQTIDRKHLTSWTGNLPTRFVLISNELPRLGDSSGAMPSRMVVLNLTRSFFGQEDTDLTRRLLAELPSILIWAIAGWARLRQRGRFTQPASSRGLLEDMEVLSSPISSFVADHCEIGEQHETPIKDVFEVWKEWCKEQGRDHPGDHAGFGRSLRAAVPSIKTVQVKEGTGVAAKKIRAFRGLRLTAAF